MKRRVLLTLLVLALPLAAQEAKKEEKPGLAPVRPKDWITSVVPVKRQDMSSFLQLVEPLGVKVDLSGAFQSLIVTGPPEAVKAAEALITKYDVPPPPPPPPQRTRNIELTTYLVATLPQAEQQEAVPDEIAGVVKQLKSVFAYKSYRVLDTLFVRSRVGQAVEVSSIGSPPGPAGLPTNITAHYTLRLNSLRLSQDEKGSTVRLDGMRFSARIPIGQGTSFQYIDSGFNTDLDVREGQKVVVGKTGIGSSSEALILVVTAKVVD